MPLHAKSMPSDCTAKQPTIGKTVDDAIVALKRDNPRSKASCPMTTPAPSSKNIAYRGGITHEQKEAHT